MKRQSGSENELSGAAEEVRPRGQQPGVKRL